MRCRSTHKAKVQCFKVNCKFPFIFVSLTILVTAIYLPKQRITREKWNKEVRMIGDGVELEQDYYTVK